MARKKHHKKRVSGVRRRSRSRVSGLAGIEVSNVFAAVLGGIGAKMVDKFLPATTDKKTLAAVKIGVGLLLPMVSKEARTKAMLTAAGTGFVVVGGLDLLKSLNILAGLGVTDASDFTVVRLNADSDLNVVNGDNDLNVVNGEADQYAEFE